MTTIFTLLSSLLSRTDVRTYLQLRKSQAVLTQAAERAAELLESKRMVDETGRRLKEKKEVIHLKVNSIF